jgi:hypothetical protein
MAMAALIMLRLLSVELGRAPTRGCDWPLGGLEGAHVDVQASTDRLVIKGAVSRTWLMVFGAGRIEIDGDVSKEGNGELWLHSTGPIVIAGDVGPVIINWWAPSLEVRGKTSTEAHLFKGDWWSFGDKY